MKTKSTEEGTRSKAARGSPVSPVSLGEVARVFGLLGITAFGGPAVHVAMMERELVERRNWITRERFLDLFSASSIIPGPGSTELAIFLGYERGGAAGLLVAGTCFILPAALLTALLAWVYVRFGAVPATLHVLTAVKPVVIAVVLHAVATLAPKAVSRSWLLALVGVASCAASLLGAGPLTVIVSAGALVVAVRAASRGGSKAARGMFAADVSELSRVALGAGASPEAPKSAWGVLLVFLKIGAVSFGGGYVLVALLRHELVEERHWLSEPQLLDAVAVGQLTPGPVFSTATFIGYLLFGAKGAALATFGIFFPGFVLVAATRPLIARMRASRLVSGFIDGANVAAVALMLVATLYLVRSAINSALTLSLAVVAALCLARFKVSSAWLVVGAGLIGVAASRL